MSRLSGQHIPRATVRGAINSLPRPEGDNLFRLDHSSPVLGRMTIALRQGLVRAGETKPLAWPSLHRVGPPRGAMVTASIGTSQGCGRQPSALSLFQWDVSLLLPKLLPKRQMPSLLAGWGLLLQSWFPFGVTPNHTPASQQKSQLCSFPRKSSALKMLRFYNSCQETPVFPDDVSLWFYTVCKTRELERSQMAPNSHLAFPFLPLEVYNRSRREGCSYCYGPTFHPSHLVLSIKYGIARGCKVL